MNRVSDRIDEALVGVGREVDQLGCPRGDRADNLDVEQHLAVRPLRCLIGDIGGAVDTDGSD